MFLIRHRRVAAIAAVVAAMVAVSAPVSMADGSRSMVPLDSPAGTERVDVAAISFHDSAVRLGADDGTGQPRDPESLVYTTEQDGSGVEVGWDTGDLGRGKVYGDAVTMLLREAQGPAEFHTEALRLPAGERGETTWSFPEPGTYTLTFAVETHLLTGEPVRTEERYTVAVQPRQDVAVPESRPEPQNGNRPPVAAAPWAERPAQAAPAAPRAQEAPVTPGRVVLDEGHVDAVAPRLLDGNLRIQVKDGTAVGRSGGRVHWREPSDVVFHAKPATRATLPNDPKLAFLGNPGTEVFLLPQQQQQDVLWTGWSTEELRAGQVTGPVTLRLTKVDGPGAFGIFTTGSFGESTVIFNSVDGLPDSHPIALGTHAHANWGFAKQGIYRLSFDAAVKLRSGRTVRDSAVYTFAVGDVDPNTAVPGGVGGEDNGGGDGDGADDSGTVDDAGDDANLADTGATGVLPMTAGGVLLVGLGGAAVLVSRKRRKAVDQCDRR